MNKLFTRSSFIVLFISLSMLTKLNAQTVFETVASGNWDDLSIWRSWASGTIGVGNAVTPVANAPVGTNNIVIHSGHTVGMNAKNRSCYGLVIENGGKLWAAEPSARRLQIATGGTGFPYPANGSIQNDGIIGGPGDGIYFEAGTNAGNITISGLGTYDIGRIRIPGGIGSTAGGIVNVIIDADINLYQAANYALSASYNPTLTDNYTITINSGKTVKLIDTAAYFSYSQLQATYGNYTYDIKGTLDLSANDQALNNVSSNITVPAPSTSKIIINVDGGVLKLGSAFKADTSLNPSAASAGILILEATNGGVIDASNTLILSLGKTTDGAGGIKDVFIGLDATGRLSRTVGPTEVKFPIGLNTGGASNNAYLTNTGTEDIFTVGLKNTFDYPLVDPTKVVNRQWDIQEAVAGGSNVTVRLAWLTADQQNNFNPLNQIYTIHYEGGWSETAATITGSGTITDPYISSTSGYTSFSPFGIDNQFGAVVPITFVNIKAYQDANNNIRVDWANATELNINHYIIEKSADGINFSEINSVLPKTNNSLLNSYSWLDESAVNGTNFYRIKAVEQSSTSKYSSIAKVALTNNEGGVTVYPNRIAGNGTITIQLTNMTKGTYATRLIDLNGQVLMSGTFNHNGGSAAQSLLLNSSITKGMYLLEVNNPGKNKATFKIVVE